MSLLDPRQIYLEEHLRLTDAMMEETGCDFDFAYEAQGDAAWDAMRDRLAAIADSERMNVND